MVSGPNGRRVTVRDIAARSGVSIATVSRVLNGRDHVAPETRDLVRNAAEQLRAGAPGSARAAAGAVYLRCPYVLTDYFGLIVSAVAETLALHGRAVVLVVVDPRTPVPRDIAAVSAPPFAGARSMTAH